jgi:hypothetical protein
MVSLINSNNLSFIGKIVIIMMVVFFILNNAANIDKYESILLSVIVAVSIIIIENICYINYIATDPLNCEQCKITDINYTTDPNKIVKSELISNPENVVPEYSEEPFASNLSELISNFSKNFTGTSENKSQENVALLKQKDEKVEELLKKVDENKHVNAQKIRILKSTNNDDSKFKCVQLPNNSEEDLDSMSNEELRTLLKHKLSNESHLLAKLEEENTQLKTKNDIMQKNKEITSLKTELESKRAQTALGSNKKLSDPYNNGSENIEGFSNLNNVENENLEDEGALLNEYIQEQNKKNKKLNTSKKSTSNNTNKKSTSNELPNDVSQKIKKIKKQMSNNKSKKSKKNKSPSKESENLNEYESENLNENLNESVNSNESENSGNSEISAGENDSTYGVNTVEYQQDGLQQEANDISGKQNIFKMGVGNPNIVRPYIKDGEQYYDTIFSESVNAPTSGEALTNELKYGYYNYVGPLNKGMINKDYTFVSPENWYPIPPHPPVCVTNKKCTTCPIQITDGKDYMSFASIEDFDKARRFTGSMNINTKYVKEVLNNPDGF